MRNNQNRLGAQQQAAAAQAPVAGLVFEVPTEFVELPSKGKFYSSEHPLYNQKTIEIKLMTTKEEDILASSALIKQGVMIDRLLESIIVSDINPKTLLVGDKGAIMIAARISAYGFSYDAKVTCGECYASKEHTFDLRKMKHNEACFDEKKLKELGVTWNSENCAYDYKLPKSGVKISLMVPAGDKDDIENQLDEGNLITDSLKAVVCSVEDNCDPQYVSAFVDSMLARDSKSLRSLLPLIVPNIDISEIYVCETCGHTEKREVPLTAEFFWPR